MSFSLIVPTERAERILFEGIVDYAGLYPPAALTMAAAVRNYALYRAGGTGWMLGRFICPCAALTQFSTEAESVLPRDADALPWHVSVTGSGDLAADLRAIAAFNTRHVVGAVVDTIEVRANAVAEIEAINGLVPRALITFIEIPVVHDPAPLLAAIAHAGRRPKIRMGGTTPDAFPAAADVVRFLSQCAELDLVAKATAGLHHPLRGTFRLTYDEHAVAAPMFGFVNVFLAVALMAGGGSADEAVHLLREHDVQSVEVSEHSIVWRHEGRAYLFDRALLHRVRERMLVSFGSCSFLEPVDESRALGLLSSLPIRRLSILTTDHRVNNDPTVDPALRSWVPSAGVHGTDFPIQNLPFGVFRRAGSQESPRVGTAIGDRILDIPACLAAGLIGADDPMVHNAAAACASTSLNALMACGIDARRALRGAISALLATGASANQRQIAEHALVLQREAELFLPAQIGDYTDFYASLHHAANVGALFRPDNPVLPNYKWVPIGYHGRSSSIVVSGTSITRPAGQRVGPNESIPTVGPTRALDYEVELGAFICIGNTLGKPIALADADAHLFGVCLLNDWSARDIQSWEYQPLGPFLAKNFATSISPWVVTLDALAPFRAPLAPRAADDPWPLPYLDDAGDRAHGGMAIVVELWLQTAKMRDDAIGPEQLTRGSALDLYWTLGQMLAHHASGGCNMRPGDLLGTGTISGPHRDNRGCLLELTRRGAEPVTLCNGEVRRFLEDGDEVILRGYADAPDAVRIGFGECRGIIRGN